MHPPMARLNIQMCEKQVVFSYLSVESATSVDESQRSHAWLLGEAGMAKSY